MAQAAGLAQRSISAVLWGASGSAVQMVLQFGIQVVLARLLGPDQYGLFALALVVITLCNYFALNLVAALIQKRDLSEDDIRFITFWQVTIGAAVAASVYLGAGTAAGFFHEPRVAPLLEAMAIVCLLQAAAGVPLSLLTRELELKSMYLANIAGYAVRHGAPRGAAVRRHGRGLADPDARALRRAVGRERAALACVRARHAVLPCRRHGDADAVDLGPHHAGIQAPAADRRGARPRHLSRGAILARRRGMGGVRHLRVALPGDRRRRMPRPQARRRRGCQGLAGRNRGHRLRCAGDRACRRACRRAHAEPAGCARPRRS